MTSSRIKPVANYAGLFNPETTPHNENLMDMAKSGIQPMLLFSVRYQVMPCTLNATLITHFLMHGQNQNPKYLHATSVIQFLIDEYKLDPNTFISNMMYDAENKLVYYSDIYIDLGDYVSIHLSHGHLSPKEIDNPLNLKPDTADKRFSCFGSITAYCIPQTVDRAQTIIAQLLHFNIFLASETCLLMVCFNQQTGFYTSNISIKRPVIKDLRLNYGDKFPAVHEKLLEQLSKPNSTGITFLHGPPGTGKTYYIRCLINEIKEKSLIYVPPDLVNEITKPGFLPFLMQHPDAILIIEDAENIILDRKECLNPNQAVSNLLNLSDGLLGDAMRLQIITTFNCEMTAIDPALLREGRLIVEHKFEKLSIDDARRLYNEMDIEGADQIDQPMSLAEIYAKKSAS